MPYSVVVDRTVPLSRERFFAHLADFGAIAKLLPDGIESFTIEGEGVGAVRRVKLRGTPGTIVERMECAFDQRVFSYSVIEEAPLPIEAYHAVVMLDDAPDGGCRVVYASNWRPKGASVEEVRVMLTGLYNTIIDAVVKAG
jgi:hypothetical protein